MLLTDVLEIQPPVSLVYKASSLNNKLISLYGISYANCPTVSVDFNDVCKLAKHRTIKTLITCLHRRCLAKKTDPLTGDVGCLGCSYIAS